MTKSKERQAQPDASSCEDYPTIDGYPEMLTFAGAKQTIQTFNDVGGDFDALWKGLSQDAAITLLRRERDAYLMNAPDRDVLQLRLRVIGELRRKAKAFRFDDRSLAVEEARLAKELKSTSPTGLADERRQAGKSQQARRLLQQIPTVRRLGILTDDPHLKAVRRHMVPEIVRIVHDVVSSSATKQIAQEERRRISSSFSRPEFGDELRRRVATRINGLTREVVAVLCPFWGYGMTSRRVSDVMKNARRRSQRPAKSAGVLPERK